MTASSFVLIAHTESTSSLASTQALRIGFTISQTFAKNILELSELVRERDLFSVEQLITPEDAHLVLTGSAGAQVPAEAWALKVTADQFWMTAFLAGTNHEVCSNPHELATLRGSGLSQD